MHTSNLELSGRYTFKFTDVKTGKVTRYIEQVNEITESGKRLAAQTLAGGSAGEFLSYQAIGVANNAIATAILGDGINVDDDKLADIIIDYGGAGYTASPRVDILGGEGTSSFTAAVAIAVVDNGAIDGFNITNRGEGYSSVPRVLIDYPQMNNPTQSNSQLIRETARRPVTRREYSENEIILSTFFPEFDLSSIIGEVGVFGGSATSDIGSGLLFSRVLLTVDNAQRENLTLSYTLTIG